MRIKIEDAKNLGPVSAAEMQALGVEYLDQIEEMGWEEFCIRYVELFPSRLNLNAFTAIIGALHDQDWRSVDPGLKSEAKQLIARIKKGTYSCPIRIRRVWND